MHIAFSSDNNYAMPAGVMIYSVCRHNENVTFHMIIPKDFTEKNKRRLESITSSFGTRIEFITISDELFEEFPVGRADQASHITIASYYRLFLSKLLPADIHRVIYLDCDLICLKPLYDMWDLDIKDTPMACVKDIPFDGISEAQRLGYDEKEGYFNAGVLLINLDFWRTHNVIGDFHKIISTCPEILKSHDQDVLNLVFKGKTLFLPPKYNAVDLLFYNGITTSQYSKEEIYEAVHSPVIVHFTYFKKPWIKGYGHPYEDTFLNYKKATPWRFSMRKVAKADCVKGFISNIFVFLGLHTYSNNYIRLNCNKNSINI